MVLDNGMVNDVGTHAQLLQRNFVYNQLWTQQHAGAGMSDTASSPARQWHRQRQQQGGRAG